MADLTTARVVLVGRKTIKKVKYPIGANIKAVEGCMAVIDTAALGFIWSGKAASATLKAVGFFTETVDNTGGASGALGVGVELFRERDCQLWDVASGGAITVASLFATVYIASNHELTATSTSNSAYGILWDFAPQGYPNGAVVEPLF